MKAQWQVGKYGLHTLALARGVEVHVMWDSTVPKDAPEERRGFQVSCLGRELVKRFKDIDEAQRAGEKLARKILHEALEALPDEGIDTTGNR